VAAKIYDGLLEYDTELKPQPSLAESWEVSPDGKTITFHLRHGVKFHDGEPLTAEDVKFSIMNVAKVTHPRGPNTFAPVTEVQTPDDHTVVLELSEPAPYMMMPTIPSGQGHSYSPSGRRASTFVSTATRTTGKKVSRISIASSRASLRIPRRAPRHWRRAKRTSRPWARCRSTTPRSLPRTRI
jgi:Bacterial extracellular solute-binding proteins, family 5 Middle